MKKKSILCIFLFIMMLCFVGCGKKDPLVGTWKCLDYYVDEQNQTIIYEEEEVVFANGIVTQGVREFPYETDTETQTVILENGAHEVRIEYSIYNNKLEYGDYTFYKVDTEECKEHFEKVKEQAQLELDVMIAKIEEEKALQEALKNASESWEIEVNAFISEYNTKVTETTKRIENEFENFVQGTWTSHSNPGHSDTYEFNGREVRIIADWGFTKKMFDATIIVEMNQNLKFDGIDNNKFSECADDIQSKFEILKQTPFDENWKLEDLQNADSFIQEKMQYLYEQIDEYDALNLETLKLNPDIMEIKIPYIERDFVSVNISSLEDTQFSTKIKMGGGNYYELSRQ